MIGHLIALLRKSHGLDVNLLAARANVKPSSILAIEAGTKEPTTRELLSLARYFNLTPEDLAGLPAPGLEQIPEWRKLKEALFQHGEEFGMADVKKYLVVMVHAWGKELTTIKRLARKGA